MSGLMERDVLSQEALELKREIKALGPWFHNLHLPDGTQTERYHPLGDFPACKWVKLGPLLPEDLTGWTALDIGCNAGFYTFELAKRGARVTGVDVDPHYLDQAQWAAGKMGLSDRVEFQHKQVYDLARDAARYDLILFMGVFYHLRYPMLALDIVSQKLDRLMVFQTLTMPGTEVYSDTHGLELNDRQPLLEPGWPKMAFLEHHFAGDPTNWWAPNHAGVEAMLRSAGLRVLHNAGHEIYLAEPDPERPSCVATWNVGEYRSATGTGD